MISLGECITEGRREERRASLMMTWREKIQVEKFVTSQLRTLGD